MKAMTRDHLRLTTDEVVAGLQHKWAADVRAYDRIHFQILRMSDKLAESLCSSQLASDSTIPEMATRGKRHRLRVHREPAIRQPASSISCRQGWMSPRLMA
jgi:hypothetical protein